MNKNKDMNICIWSGTSFEKFYASYHLMEYIIKAILSSGHSVYLIQKKIKDGIMPKSLCGEKNLHILNIPWREPEKKNFVKRYIDAVKYYLISAKELKKIRDIDVIFLQSNNVAFFPVKIANILNIPIVYNVQDIFPMDALVVGKLKKNHPAYIMARWLQRLAYKKANRVITISDDMAKTIRGEGREDVDVIYNWSYQNEAFDIKDEHNHFLKRYQIKREDGFRVVYAGNIGQMIDIEMFVKISIYLKKYNDIKIYIIGEGSNLRFLEERIKKEGINNILIFPPQPMEYARDNYCMADININPIPRGVIYTCMPSKLNTCMLSEKPTIVAMEKKSNMAQKLASVDKWFIVESGDAKAMADVIIKQYKSNNWNMYSNNSGEFIRELGPIENAYMYVNILKECIK